jgi:hypothetical protein
VERIEAIDYLKHLLGEDINLSPDSVSIEKQDNTKEVKIYIKTQERKCIKDVAIKRNLKVLENGDTIIIFGNKLS